MPDPVLGRIEFGPKKTIRQYTDWLDEHPNGIPTLREIKARVPTAEPLPLLERLEARRIRECVAIRVEQAAMRAELVALRADVSAILKILEGLAK